MNLEHLSQAIELAPNQRSLESDPPHPHEVPVVALYDDDPVHVLRCAVCRWPAMVVHGGFKHLDSRVNP